MRVSIKDIAEVQIGYQIREGLRPSLDGTHFVIQAKDIDEESDHSLVVEALERITPVRDASPYIVRNGDVLFLSRGRRNYATVVAGLPENPPSIALYYFFILRLDRSLVHPAFLVWAVNEEESQEYIKQVATGTAMPFVTKRAFSSLVIDLPSLNKQSQIGRLCQLASREKQLRRKIEKHRSELVRAACRVIHESKDEAES